MYIHVHVSTESEVLGKVFTVIQETAKHKSTEVQVVIKTIHLYVHMTLCIDVAAGQ